MKPDRLLVMNNCLCEHLVGPQGGLDGRLVYDCVGTMIIFDNLPNAFHARWCCD